MNEIEDMIPKGAGSSFDAKRGIFAFCVVPLAVASLYTVAQVGKEDFFPFVFFAVVVAYLVALVFFAPLCTLLHRTGRGGIFQLLSATYILGFVVFFGLYWVLATQFDQYDKNGIVFVRNGVFTEAGLIAALTGALVAAGFSAFGAILFLVIARRQVPENKGAENNKGDGGN